MSEYTWLWLLWFAQFVAIEGQALIKKRPGATLSEHIWKWASMKDKTTWWRARRIALLSFLAWLSAHLISVGRF